MSAYRKFNVQNAYQRLCHECNTETKNGFIDMVHPHAREFWLNVKAAIEEAENRAEDYYMLLETGRPIEAIYRSAPNLVNVP